MVRIGRRDRSLLRRLGRRHRNGPIRTPGGRATRRARILRDRGCRRGGGFRRVGGPASQGTPLGTRQSHIGVAGGVEFRRLWPSQRSRAATRLSSRSAGSFRGGVPAGLILVPNWAWLTAVFPARSFTSPRISSRSGRPGCHHDASPLQSRPGSLRDELPIATACHAWSEPVRYWIFRLSGFTWGSATCQRTMS